MSRPSTDAWCLVNATGDDAVVARASVAVAQPPAPAAATIAAATASRAPVTGRTAATDARARRLHMTALTCVSAHTTSGIAASPTGSPTATIEIAAATTSNVNPAYAHSRSVLGTGTTSASAPSSLA